MLNDDSLVCVSSFLNLQDLYHFFSLNHKFVLIGNDIINFRCRGKRYGRIYIKEAYIAFKKYIKEFRRRKRFRRIRSRVRNDDTPILLF